MTSIAAHPRVFVRTFMSAHTRAHCRTIGLTIALTITLAAAALASACASDPREGYSFAPTHRTDVTSIGVPMFNNVTQDFGLEQELTAAVVAELRRTTSYTVTSPDNAQTVLSGTITQSNLRKLSTARDTGLAETLAVQLTVDFQWRQARTGKVLTSRRNFTASDTFTASRGVGERLEIGQNAAIDKLAKDIVAEMRSGW